MTGTLIVCSRFEKLITTLQCRLHHTTPSYGAAVAPRGADLEQYEMQQRHEHPIMEPRVNTTTLQVMEI